HLPRQGDGDARSTRIFEAKRQCARDVAIGNSGAHAIHRRRIGEAGAAQRLAARVEQEGLAACAACGTVQKIELLPALDAEQMISEGNDAASRAARREREIEYAPQRPLKSTEQRLSHCSHGRLSTAAARGTSPSWSFPKSSIAACAARGAIAPPPASPIMP